MATGNNYLQKLRERAKKSRVRTKHQFVGLQIGRDLDDIKHKALYMKLAKKGNPAKLQWLAADVASRRGIQKKGAYFMKVLFSTEKEAKECLRGVKKSKHARKVIAKKRRKQTSLFSN